MLHSEIFDIPAYVVPAFREVIPLNKRDGEGDCFIQTFDTINDYTSARIIGIGKTFYVACEMAEEALEGKNPILLPPPCRQRDSQHVGTPGESITFDGYFYHAGVWIHPEYGASFIYRIEDSAGNEFTWYTKTKVSPRIYSIKGTIKGHAEYDFVKQTQLTRVKVNADE